MLRETVSRLAPIFAPRRFLGQSPTSNKPPPSAANCAAFPPSHILAEPVGRNTAAAIGLAAIHLRANTATR